MEGREPGLDTTRRVYAIGTADTKGEELAFLAERIRAAGVPVRTIDVGTRGQGGGAWDARASAVAGFHPQGAAAVLGLNDRGRAVSAMGEALERFLLAQDDIAGVVGIGGGGGTSVVTRGMRALPLGLPKLMVSTLASGDTSAFVDVSDILMMPAVTDMAGLNGISRVVLHNAARAIAGMALRPAPRGEAKPALGLTMFGVTTPCVTAVVERLKAQYDCTVFHATGTGGRTMEKLADSGFFAGLIDLTTTEVADLLVGGVLPATDDRFGALARTRAPAVVSVGACDMVNFWAPETVPERFKGRTFYQHNPNVTLMRTTPEECAALGRWIGGKLSGCDGPLRVLLPERGVSALDIESGAFWDRQADEALFSALEDTIRPTNHRRVERLPLHINDPAFAEAVVGAWREVSSG